ncbi:MAG: heterodisulfide reductase, subunit B [Deltaproteobacteria bacterium]|nr:MAG: heterodisulfide reductase, subunit B [Deltaproteobacteria bacterium]
MKISYYPGCTLKTKARNLDVAALASLEKLGVEVRELDRWNCCGAVFSLTNDDLIHMIGPVRNLVRAKEQGADKLVTLCSMCYNTLARANQLIRNDKVKCATINRFMDEEIDYFGEVEVVHYLNFVKDDVGWDKVREMVVAPVENLRIAPYYGCTLQRPADVGIEPFGSFEIMGGLLEAIGAEVTEFDAADKCCGSYQLLTSEGGAERPSAVVADSAIRAGAEAVVTSCPLCEYNLGRQGGVPTYYFTQLLAVALGVSEEECHFQLNTPASVDLLKEKGCLLV